MIFYPIGAVLEFLRVVYMSFLDSEYAWQVWNEEWISYSSTNSRSACVLFRIRNTATTDINFRTVWYYSCFDGWGQSIYMV